MCTLAMTPLPCKLLHRFHHLLQLSGLQLLLTLTAEQLCLYKFGLVLPVLQGHPHVTQVLCSLGKGQVPAIKGLNERLTPVCVCVCACVCVVCICVCMCMYVCVVCGMCCVCVCVCVFVCVLCVCVVCVLCVCCVCVCCVCL